MKKKKQELKLGIIQSYKMLWGFMGKKEKATFISIFVMSIISSLTQAYGALIPSLIIAKFTGEKVAILQYVDFLSLDTVPYLFVICGIMVLLWVFGMLNYRMVDIFARRMMCVVNEKGQEIILQERKNLDFGMTTGETNYILKNAIDNIYAIVEPVCWRLATNVISVVFMVAQLFMLSFVIGLIAIGLVAIILVCVFVRTLIQKPVVEKIESTNAKIGNHFLMSLTNLPMITIFESKKRELEELKKLNDKFFKVNKKRANIGFWYWLVVISIEYLGLAAAVAVFAVMNPGVSIVAAVTMIINEIMYIYGMVENWGFILSDLQTSAIKFCNLQKIYPEKRDLLEEAKRTNKDVENNALESVEVVDYTVELGSFKKTYNIKFEKGKVYVISGQSGQGKTTLINAICGFREIVSGHLLINGKHKVKSLYNYRKKISYLFQDSLLFDRSLEENIAYPDTELNDKAKELIEKFDVAKIIKRNNANKLITHTLSGGEKKRIDIIRTVSKNRELYLLDEPTNDLDAKNVARVVEVIRELANENKIVIVISHDERCTSTADEIVSL